MWQFGNCHQTPSKLPHKVPPNCLAICLQASSQTASQSAVAYIVTHFHTVSNSWSAVSCCHFRSVQHRKRCVLVTVMCPTRDIPLTHRPYISHRQTWDSSTPHDPQQHHTTNNNNNNNNCDRNHNKQVQQPSDNQQATTNQRPATHNQQATTTTNSSSSSSNNNNNNNNNSSSSSSNKSMNRRPKKRNSKTKVQGVGCLYVGCSSLSFLSLFLSLSLLLLLLLLVLLLSIHVNGSVAVVVIAFSQGLFVSLSLSLYHTFFLPFSFHCVPTIASLLTMLQTLKFIYSCIHQSIFTRTNKHSDTKKRFFHSSLWPTNCKCKATRYRAKTLCTVCPGFKPFTQVFAKVESLFCMSSPMKHHRQRGFMYRDSKEICRRKWAFWVMLKNLSAIWSAMLKMQSMDVMVRSNLSAASCGNAKWPLKSPRSISASRLNLK